LLTLNALDFSTEVARWEFDGNNSVRQAHEEHTRDEFGGMIGTNWRADMRRVLSLGALDRRQGAPSRDPPHR